uniref:28S ribosomal protein S30, mitochondrial n=1 Tax=Cacopsylla melanoneura TaxID=428564 RepID=A0A8D8W351_9HEMI
MSIFHSNRGHGFKRLQFLRHYTSVSNETVVSKNIYPPILDISEKAKKGREALAMHAKIQALNTVEEKLLALNVPRYYGWESLVLKEGRVPYNFLPFIKSVTKTKVHQVDKECIEITLTQEKVDELLKNIKSQLGKVLVYHSQSQRHRHELESEEQTITDAEADKIKADNLVDQINRVLVSNLSKEYPHLLSAQVDYRPRIEAFWNVGGLGLTEAEREKRKKKNVPEELLDEPSNKWIQYFGSPLIQLRSNLPLTPLTDITPTQSSDCEEFPYDPVLTYALETKRYHGATLPGYWPDDEHKYGLLSFHSLPLKYNADDFEESLDSTGLLASWAWLLGQAAYHGFTTFNDITYPLVTQTIVSNGKLLSLYSYQMNTCVTFTDSGKRNDCYTSGPMELYSSIEDGQIKGWNDGALRQLLSMYTNKPQQREGLNMSPYLNPDESLVQKIENEKKRIWLHKTYRYFTAHRNRYLEAPEIFDWEYIYKVAFETRPMDARKRFFERDEDPLEERPLYDTYKYIPKPERPETEPKKRHEDQFYPEVLEGQKNFKVSTRHRKY